jgi:DNA-binding NarL/FixJ family response regulator
VIRLLIADDQQLAREGLRQLLRITAGTVKIHVSGVLSKIGVRTRVQAAIHAYRSGLVSSDEEK